LSQSDYENLVHTPVQNCLNTAGRTNILYIVLAYVRPYQIYIPSVSTYYALDSFLADPWNQYTSQVFYPIPTSPHRYYADIQSHGGVYTPFQDLATYRTQPKSSLIYAV